MAKIINLFSGPGGGKSTLAGELFGYMKSNRMNVEYITEFAKELTWKKDYSTLDDQLYVTFSQHHKQYLLLNEVDYIITDSPILLGIIYLNSNSKKFNNRFDWEASFINLVYNTFDQYDNYNFVIERGNKPYISKGRNQSEHEALHIDREVIRILEGKYSYHLIKNIEDILLHLKLIW